MDLEKLSEQTKYSKEEITGYSLFDLLAPKEENQELFYKDLFSLINQTKKVKTLHDKYFSKIESDRQIALDRQGVTPVQVRLNRIYTICQLQESAINKLSNISETSNMYDSLYHTTSSSLRMIAENLESAKNKLETFAIEENVYCHNLTQELSQIISEIKNLQANTLLQEQQIIHNKDLVDQRNSLKISQLKRTSRQLCTNKKGLEASKEKLLAKPDRDLDYLKFLVKEIDSVKSQIDDNQREIYRLSWFSSTTGTNSILIIGLSSLRTRLEKTLTSFRELTKPTIEKLSLQVQHRRAPIDSTFEQSSRSLTRSYKRKLQELSKGFIARKSPAYLAV